MKAIFIFLALSIGVTANAQQDRIYQNIKGTVYDAESKKELEGVTIHIQPGNQTILTDKYGQFYFKNVTVGRYNLVFTYIGFETKEVVGIELNAGKELDVTVNMITTITSLNDLLVKSSASKKAKNEFAVVSSRSFSLKDAKLYPASFSDPARMVSNFSGVTIANDGANGIVVRGNSPKGILWKLNGIEIPNPNHFSIQGSANGAVSMLSTNVVGNSDFYTGAFPAEFGNAVSGVFDLNFRKGNKDKPEYAFSLGGLGLEAAAEGPLNKKKQSSYLVNYRYSSLALIGQLLSMNGELPKYQDVSFNLSYTTAKAGTINVFGLGGLNEVEQKAKKDSTLWIKENEINNNMTLKNKLGVLGVEHQISVSKNSYIKTIASISYTSSESMQDTLNPAANYRADYVGDFNFVDHAFRLSSFLNTRLNTRNILRIGFSAQQLSLDYKSSYYDDVEKRNRSIFSDKGTTQFYEAYTQWKFRPVRDLTFNLGVHGTIFVLNKKSSIEPRMSMNYKIGNGQSLSFAAGFHSKLESLATYYFEDAVPGSAKTNPNKNLETPKAFHSVAGYEIKIQSVKSNLKLETYFQQLHHIAVEKDLNSGFSTINMENVFELRDKLPLISKGKGRNYGIDMSLEHPVHNGFYYMANISLFKSVYTNYAGKEFNTQYGRNYSSNFNVGREWAGHKKKNRATGVNARLVAMGGLRENPIDLPLSVSTGKEEYVKDKYFTIQNDAYFRIDMSVYVRTNRKKSTNTFVVEMQNVTNRINTASGYFDRRTSSIKRFDQLGLFPNITYKIQF
ncbi:MAG: TonB-dependent receptor [Chitinophagaceae bacterium]